MADEPTTSEESTDEAESEEVDPEVKAQAERDAAVSTPGPDAPAEPYYAIMTVEDGETTGNVWSWGPRIMLFYEESVANKILNQLEDNHDLDWELRGVTEEHLEALGRVAESSDLNLFVVAGFTAEGKVEAVPLEEHVPPKKPPPLPPGIAGKKAAAKADEDDEETSDDASADDGDDEDGSESSESGEDDGADE